jgi:hypothetical protein
LDEDAINYLQVALVDLDDLDAIVQALAEHCQPSLPDVIALIERFSSETCGTRTPEDYYYALLEYHTNNPQAISAMQVLVQFLQTVRADLSAQLYNNLVHFRALPSQQFLVKLIRTCRPVSHAAAAPSTRLAAPPQPSSVTPSPVPTPSPHVGATHVRATLRPGIGHALSVVAPIRCRPV